MSDADANPPPAAASTRDVDFMLEEYRTLRAEIEAVIHHMRNSERNCVVAVVAVYAWIATHPIRPEFKAATWLLPMAAPVFGALYYWSLQRHVRTVAKYLIQIEQFMLAGAPLNGWEHHVNAQSKLTFNKAPILFWVGLNVLTLTLSVLGRSAMLDTSGVCP